MQPSGSSASANSTRATLSPSPGRPAGSKFLTVSPPFGSTTFLWPNLASPKPLACHSLINGNDVAFVFPFEQVAHPPPVLWARQADLMVLSSYFSSMFMGGFRESHNVLLQTSKILEACQNDLAKIVAEERAKGQPDHTLGDEDGKTACTSSRPLQWHFSLPIRYIVVRDFSHATYEAFLKWHLTKEIHFTPLKHEKDAFFPQRTVCCKSVYKLAHQLGIKALEDLAAKNFEEQLTHSNVLEELFSPICFTYPTLKEAAMRALERNWAQIIASNGLDTISTLVQSDDSDAKEIAMLALEILKMAPRIFYGQTLSK